MGNSLSMSYQFCRARPFSGGEVEQGEGRSIPWSCGVPVQESGYKAEEKNQGSKGQPPSTTKVCCSLPAQTQPSFTHLSNCQLGPGSPFL